MNSETPNNRSADGSSNSSSPSGNAVGQFFIGVSEHVFHSRLGVVDTQLVDYVSNLLCRFMRTENLHRIRFINGRPITEVVGMLMEAKQRVGEAKREVHRHIGDFTLFWAGMYPEALREMRGPDRRDQFISYSEEGKRAYHVAALIETSRDDLPCSLMRRLSEQFDMCAYGLREIRREWEQGDTGPLH
jgi:hypothetical protein